MWVTSQTWLVCYSTFIFGCWIIWLRFMLNCLVKVRTLEAAINWAEGFHRPTFTLLMSDLKSATLSFELFSSRLDSLSICAARPAAASCSIMHMCVNDRVRRSQSLCVSVRVTAELCWCWVTARWRREREKQGSTQQVMREFLLLGLYLCNERKRWRWVYCSLRKTCRQHCYCSYSLNQRTWLQVLCQWASALRKNLSKALNYYHLQGCCYLTDLVLWCFCGRGQAN